MQPAQWTRPLAVLVVDDDDSVARMVAAVLRRDGLEVAVAADGHAALAALETRPFDAVLTDMTMPGMNGLELARAADAAGCSAAFLVMSAFLDPDTEQRLCDEPRIVGVLRKPFDIGRLLRDVRAVLEPPAPAPAPCYALVSLSLVRQCAFPPARPARAQPAASRELAVSAAGTC
ncbi:MAG: response regulator [Planctomycetota bacterium]